jgi:hypothetical protein
VGEKGPDSGRLAGAKSGNIEFLVPLRRRDGIPRSVLRAVVETGGILKVLSDVGRDTHRGSTWARVLRLRQELFSSVEAPWAVSLDSDVVTTGRCINAAVRFLMEHEDYGAVAVTYHGHLPPEEAYCGYEVTLKDRGHSGAKSYRLRGPHYPAGLIIGRGEVFRACDLLGMFSLLPAQLRERCECLAVSEAILAQGVKMRYLDGYVAADLKLRDRLGYVSTPYRVVAVLRWYPLEVKPEPTARMWLKIKPGSVVRADWFVRGVGVVERPDGRLSCVGVRRSFPVPMHDAVGDRARWTDDGRLLPMRHSGR